MRHAITHPTPANMLPIQLPAFIHSIYPRWRLHDDYRVNTANREQPNDASTNWYHLTSNVFHDYTYFTSPFLAQQARQDRLHMPLP